MRRSRYGPPLAAPLRLAAVRVVGSSVGAARRDDRHHARPRPLRTVHRVKDAQPRQCQEIIECVGDALEEALPGSAGHRAHLRHIWSPREREPPGQAFGSDANAAKS